MLADVWTWVRLPPAPLFFHQPWKNVVKSTFFIFAFGILFLKRDTKKDTTFVVSKKIIFLFYGRHGIRTHARCYTPTAFPTRPLKPLE